MSTVRQATLDPVALVELPRDPDSRLVPLKLVRRDGGRLSLDPSTIEQFAALMLEGVTFPAVV
jgi:hypothetical protein